jgi:hypothetical protein
METLAKIGMFFQIPDNKFKSAPYDIPNVDRTDLAKLFAHLGFNEGVELGTEQGLYAETLLQANPSLHLHCVDPWLAYEGYREHVSQPKLDGFFEATQAKLSNFHVTYHRKTSADALLDFADHSLDFVYVDANHTFEHVAHDVSKWEKKVRRGGILAGHDYRRHRPGPYQCHVVEVVTAYTQAYAINPWFILGSKDVVPGEKRDSSRSYFWVKE